MIETRLANKNDINKVVDFYKIVCADKNNKARWHYGIYPTDDDLINDISNKELFILLEDDEIVSAAVLRMQNDELYKDVNWKNNNPAVVHILATLPSKWHQGYGRKLLLYLIEIAKDNNKDSLRLDIVNDNDNARKLYESVGFVHREDKELYYPDTGVILSSLFELII